MDRLLEATYRAEQQHFWFHGFRQFVAPLLQRAAAGRQSLTILDCGCGTGNNLNLLDPYGRTFGFDLTWRGLEFARGHGRTRIARATITAIPFRSGTFDLLTSFDVLQSITAEQEASALPEMFRVLKPGGSLVLNVAALELLHGNHAVLAEEVRRYTRPMLRKAVAAAGFSIERTTYTNTLLFPLMLGVRLAQRAIGLATPEEAGREIAVPAAPINAALTGVLSFEAKLVRVVNMPIGSSLICLAKKPDAA